MNIFLYSLLEIIFLPISLIARFQFIFNFIDVAAAPLEDIAEEEQFEEDGDIGEDDEMADFIVEEEEVDEHGAPVR